MLGSSSISNLGNGVSMNILRPNQIVTINKSRYKVVELIAEGKLL